MNSKYFLILNALIFLYPFNSKGQESLTICNTFDASTTQLILDTTGIWEIGNPTKSTFNSSYSGLNSIVTDLDALYSDSDTSRFYVVFKDALNGGFPNYLGFSLPLEIEFYHRFLTDSITDYGTLDLSLDDGNTWYDVLSSEYNSNDEEFYLNEHLFENTGVTLYDSLLISGNSGGWIHSQFSKDINDIVFNDNLYPDSLILRFSFISDSLGGNEGWQIDDLCISMDTFDGITEIQKIEQLSINPNPNNGEFSINETGHLRVFNLLGKEVFSEIVTNGIITTNLSNGIYVVTLTNADTLLTKRILIEE